MAGGAQTEQENGEVVLLALFVYLHFMGVMTKYLYFYNTRVEMDSIDRQLK